MIIKPPQFSRHAIWNGDSSEEPPGLRQASMADAIQFSSPRVRRVLQDAPVRDGVDYTVDTKTHMLMPGQYPCIPGWHCDAIPRGEDGKLRYDMAREEGPDMLIWISAGPETEFIADELQIPDPVEHSDLGWSIEPAEPRYQQISPQSWYRFGWHSPHRGRPAEKAGWRVFIRLIESRYFPPLPRGEILRAHSQVYLDAGRFSW